MIIRAWCDNGMAGGEQVVEIEMSDNATNSQIEAEVRDWFFERNTYGWTKSIATPAQSPPDGGGKE
jgi:hypothetical protein